MKSRFFLVALAVIVTCLLTNCNGNGTDGFEVKDGQVKLVGSYWTGDGDIRSIAFRSNGNIDLYFSDSYSTHQWSARNGSYSVFTENNTTKIDVSFEASFYPYGATSPFWITFHGIQTIYGDKEKGYTMPFIVSGTLPSYYGDKTFVSSMKMK